MIEPSLDCRSARLPRGLPPAECPARPVTGAWRLLLWTCLSAASLLPPSPLLAGQRDYLVDVWNVDHGLPQGSVMHVAQTPEGYLWTATFWQGIARFDGVRFVNYTPVTTPELPDQEGWRLLVDSRGTLWISSLVGSLTSWREGRFALEFERKWRLKSIVLDTPSHVVFATHEGMLVRGPAIPGQDGPWELLEPPGADMNSQFAGDGESIWYTRGGMQLGRWSPDGFALVDHPPGLRGRRVRVLLADHAGRIWAGTDQELAMWAGEQFVTMTPEGEPALSVLRMAFARDGSLWVEANGRLRKWRDRQWEVEARDWNHQFGPTADPVLMTCDTEGGVWFTHVGDGMIHIRADGAIRRLTTGSGLPNNLTRCWLEDREGNIWTGSERGGLMRIRQRHFQVYGKAEGLTDPIITSVAEDASGAVWSGSLNGVISRWEGEKFETFTPPLRGTRMRCATVFPGIDNRLWIGTSGNGVLVRRGDGVFEHVLEAAEIGSVARTTLADARGRVWIGNERGLFRWDGERLHSFATDALALAEGPDGTVWAGNSIGELCRIDGDRIERFLPVDDSPSCRIWALLVEPDGTVWIGTDGAGLLRFRDGAFVRFTARQGLPSQTIFQVIDDAQGRLWLGIQSGLASADKASLEALAQGQAGRVSFQVYGRYDGLPTMELCSGYQPACWRGRDGRLWFATANGVVSVQPADLRLNPLPPPVLIEEVHAGGKRVYDLAGGPSELGPVLKLPPGRHSMEFKFTGLSFTAPDKVRFRWRLEGLDSDWLRGNNELRQAAYNLVPPGDYRFVVQACNNDGVWNDAGAALAFHIPEFFWKTKWFLAFCGLAGAGGLAGWVRHVTRQRMQRRLERLEQQRSIERERTRIARDLHDDLGGSLTEISMLAAPGGAASPPTARNGDSLVEIGERADKLVRALDEIVWAVNPAHDSVASLGEYLSAYAADFLSAAGIRARRDLPRAMPAMPLQPEQRHELFLAVKEALRNAARHSRASEVWLRLEVSDDQLILRVEDNGGGFDMHNAREGNGLRNMRERLRLLGGVLEVCSKAGQGAVVEMRLPLRGEWAAARSQA